MRTARTPVSATALTSAVRRRDSSRAASRASVRPTLQRSQTQRFRQPQAFPASTPAGALIDAERNLFRHIAALAPQLGNGAFELPCGFYRRFGIANAAAPR